MRLCVIVATIALVSGLALPAAADQWSKTYPVSGRLDLMTSTGDGDVRVDVWDEARVEARIDTVGYEINKDFQLIESQSGNRISIELKFPPMNWGIHTGRHSVTVTLKVPREANLDLHTGDGGVSVAGAKGDVRLHTGDGGIDAKGLDGRLVASTGDGHITVEGRFDALDLHTGDGSVEAAAKAGSTVAAAWSVRTGDGSVTLRLPGDFKADVDARTGDGHMTLDLPVAISGSVNRSHVRGTLNGGGGSVNLHTGNGSIRLERY
ncbi:MAG TPA: DUF4097 family beta strand repeat-containing protein [Vicinamibacterales bacterium]|jgi:DUF4097 and DUF4098 domain-containing protein YvlB